MVTLACAPLLKRPTLDANTEAEAIVVAIVVTFFLVFFLSFLFAWFVFF